NDVADCEHRIRSALSVTVDDGLEFDPSSVRGEMIRDEADYTGVRVHVAVRLATARIGLHADINFGDPVWPAPAPTDLPLLLGGSIRLLSYPDHMVLAEKIVTAIERGIVNTRWRDFADIDAIAQHRNIAAADLSEAVAVVAAHRGATLSPLADALAGMAEIAQPRWIAWRRKQRLWDATPEQFQDLLDRCAALADPVLTGDAQGKTWSHEDGHWVSR
ncbi:MAG: nucleotidyl transferase AbiEii/AbiGii toxin family protein, partial [Propionibacteriaceae bacterium]|nr:nucleotidyl transferase AbiEii/AbiGii toxin family protein [Propionibacteriaceae bacterium]